ncbi:MAG TPA: hypothetical protein VF888_01335, partial [Nitrospirota bacterium]
SYRTTIDRAILLPSLRCPAAGPENLAGTRQPGQTQGRIKKFYEKQSHLTTEDAEGKEGKSRKIQALV